MEKQTSIEWFFNELQRMQYFIGNDMLEAYKQAKEMEKEQLIDFYCHTNADDVILKEFAEQHYIKTFKQD